jgi:Rod binding domain-containing protein
MSNSGLNPAVALFPQSGIEHLKGERPATLEAEKARLKKATKEFESFFMYYMLKTMRRTVPEDSPAETTGFSGGLGKDTFDQMFDMELAQHVVQGGPGSISDMLYASMEKLLEAQYNAPEGNVETKPLDQPAAPIDIEGRPAPPKAGDQDKLKETKTPDVSLPAGNVPRRIRQDEILSRFGNQITQAANLTSLDPALIYSVIKVESNGNPQAVSDAGAKGLMQLVDTTAGDYGVRQIFDPGENIRAGSQYLRNLLDRFGSLKLALAAYNAGPSNVDKYGGIPPFRETQEYVRKVLDTLGLAVPEAMSNRVKVF